MDDRALDITLLTNSYKASAIGAEVLLTEPIVWAGAKGGCAHLREPLPVSLWEEGFAWRAGALGETRRPPRPRRAPLRGLVVFVAGYVAITVVAALFAATPGTETAAGSGAGPFSAAAAGLFTVCLGGLPGSYAWPHPGLWPGFAAACTDLVKAVGRWGPAAERAGALLRRVVPRWAAPTRDALLVVLGSGAALFLVALVTGWDDAMAVWSALDAGVVGGAGLVLLNLALLPTAAVWAASFAIGPGFAMGAGTSLGPAGSSVGALPAVPVFAAVPDPVLFPDRVWLVVLVPVAAGALAGIRIARAGGGERRQLVDALGTGLLSGLVFAVLAWLSGGSLGADRMSEFGPSPLLSGVLLAGEVAVTALVTVVLWQTFRGRRPATGVETPDVTQGHRVDGGF